MARQVSQQELDSFFNLLKKLADAFGVSGYEDEVRGIIIDELKESADSLEVDRFGNIIAVKKGSEGEPVKIIWDAHMDEIGFFVKHIDDNGFLYLSPVGGWAEQILPGQRVRILTDTGKIIRGVIGMKPPHLMKQEERTKVVPLEELFVDIGVTSREEAEKLGVRVGSPVDLDREAVRLAGDRVTGKAFDDRVGVAVLVKAFKEIEPKEQTIYLVISVQEEVGLKGARVAAQKINPEVGIGVDVTTANDVPGVTPKDHVAYVGKGPALTVADGRNASGLISHPKLLRLFIETAKAEDIPYQIYVMPGGTTDATAISLVGEGVPSIAVSVPTRYIHSPVELLSLKDAVYTAMLVKAATLRITREWYRKEIEWGKQLKK